ncbi:MAG: YybH family protein [Gemmatimonadota bacterium]
MECRDIDNPEGQSLEALRRTFDHWREALRAGDLDTVVDLVTEDAEFWTNGRPTLQGRQSLRRAFAPIMEEWTLDQAFDCRELIVSGDVAFARGMESNRLVPVSGGEAVTERQRAFSVLRRGDDGVWRFARGMTNLPPEE